MKINESGRIGAINQYRKNQDSKAVPAGKAKQKDQVEISSQAKELLEMQEVDPARAEKVKNLKTSVETGTYHVESGKIAEKLLPFIK